MFSLNSKQIKHWQDKQDHRYNKMAKLLNKPNVNTNRLTIAEQADNINCYINMLLQQNRTINQMDCQSLSFIDYLDKHCFRFDSITGEIMFQGWEIDTQEGIKLFLTGQTNGKVDDERINRAEKIAIAVFGMRLKNLMSGKFGIQADWKQFGNFA